jgi:hypothetical protein
MNTSITTRLAAFVASALVTLTIVSVSANYAHPEAPRVLLAAATATAR